MKIARTLCLFLFSLLVVGCGTTTSAGYSGAQPDTLHAEIKSPLNVVEPLDKTITNVQSVQRLYKAILALPLAPQGTYHCPIDDGMQYVFTFTAKGNQLHQATLSATGCQFLTISRMDGARRASGGNFQKLVTQTLGIPSFIPEWADTLQVVRNNPPGLHLPAFTKTITLQQNIEHFYNTALALKAFPRGALMCVKDDGLIYTFRFQHAKKTLFSMTLHAEGCRTLQIDGIDHPRGTNDAFRAQVTDLLGLNTLDPH